MKSTKQVRAKGRGRGPGRALAGCVLAACLAAGWARPDPAGAVTPLQSLLSAFSRYDRDGDGADEIDFLLPMSFEDMREPVAGNERLVVVFVERRLLDELAGDGDPTGALVDRLARLKGDLDAEGFASLFLITDVYDSSDGPRHQDGLTLLAMRDFLIEVRALYPRLAGTLLIGSFPDATLVRRWVWNREGPVAIRGNKYRGNFLRIVPEVYAHRSDVVLGDLDGAWDRIYRQAETELDSIVAKPLESNWWRDGKLTIPVGRYAVDRKTYEDFFFIDDSRYSRSFDSRRRLVLNIHRQPRNPELGPEDASIDNPIARPEINVGRINARHIAVMPDPRLLNSSGDPTTAFAPPGGARLSMAWSRDARLERRLLIEFLDRDHRFRVGGDAGLPFRAGAIGFPQDLGDRDDLADWASAASSEFAPPVKGALDATLVDYVDFLTKPATLRAVMAHSGARTTEFGDDYDPADLEARTGTPWRWRWQDEDRTRAYPSFSDQGGSANFFLYRTLWENRVLAGAGPSFILHTGCEVNSPFDGDLRPYDDASFGLEQNAEAQLFYLNGLAMLARAKVFNEYPEKEILQQAFSDARARFGGIWLETFAADSGDAGLTDDLAHAKRAYAWSIVGDWTLRLRYENGFGVMTGASAEGGWAGTSTHAHADDAWIEGWNFSSDRDEFRASGDFDGDGTDEFIVTSAWGIGILGLDEGRWGADVVAPNGRRFGDWRFNSGQRILGVGNFDGRRGDEILVGDFSGMAILRQVGSRLTTVTVVPNDTRLGAWRYESHNEVEAIADLDGDGRDDIVLTSPWGIGVVTLDGSSLRAVVTKPNGTDFGGWSYDTRTDRIEGAVELDGRPGRELIVRDAQSIGVLRRTGDGFRSLYRAAQDTWMGGWKYRATDEIVAFADIDGDDRHELVVASAWGIGVLDWNGTRLASSFVAKNGATLGRWRLDTTTDRIVASGDFRGVGAADLVIADERGIATLTWSAGRLAARRVAVRGSTLGNWLLRPGDEAIGIGNFDPESPGVEWLVARSQ